MNNTPFSQFGIEGSRPKTRDTCCGKIRTISTFTGSEWTFITLSMLALSVSLAVTIFHLLTENPNSSDFTFAVLILITLGFSYHYVLSALLCERWEALIIFLINKSIILIYYTLNFIHDYQIHQKKCTSKMVRLIVSCIVHPFLISMGAVMCGYYFKSSKFSHDVVGGNTTFRKAFRLFRLSSSLLKFDLQLQVSLLILVMGKGVLHLRSSQLIIVGCGAFMSASFFIIGYLGLCLEKKILMGVFYVIGLLQPVFILHKFCHAILYEDHTSAIYNSIFISGCTALVVWVTLYFSTACFIRYYFGLNLREKIFNYKTAQMLDHEAMIDAESEPEMSYEFENNRMVVDSINYSTFEREHIST